MGMKELFDLAGQVAIVTGASSGLGAHFAETLAQAGAKVALGARRIDRLTALADKIAGNGGRALPVELDVTNAASVKAAIQTTQEELGPISILVNNAGIPSSGRAIEMEEAEWDRVLDTNLKGAWLMAREVGTHMVEHETAGRIINIASIIGVSTAAKRVLAYSVSKAGMVSLTESLAVELADKGICVNAIAPGYIETELNSGFLQSSAGQRIATRVPLGRFGETRDLDGVLLLLAGPSARYITGSVVTVDGGLSLSTL
ncbi:MAG: NAD(P)-dependent dehydrogenase (short-subunit alcohol dehydrogenase family) [Alphaproteobacteria bacterium]|jgi:NAD(P)-dependent dehydrogenase (short-subunit alcohol dehydrogenase family)